MLLKQINRKLIMNPELDYGSPVPVSFETHDLMNTMKKCSFESIGEGVKRRRGGGSQTKQTTPYKQQESIPFDQQRLVFKAPTQEFVNLAEFNVWFNEINTLDLVDPLSAVSQIIIENDVIMRDAFSVVHGSPELHPELYGENYYKYFAQFKMRLAGILNQILHMDTLEEVGDLIGLPLTQNEKEFLDIDGFFSSNLSALGSLSRFFWNQDVNTVGRVGEDLDKLETELDAGRGDAIYKTLMGNWTDNVAGDLVASVCVRYAEYGAFLFLGSYLGLSNAPLIATGYVAFKLLVVIKHHTPRIGSLWQKWRTGTSLKDVVLNKDMFKMGMDLMNVIGTYSLAFDTIPATPNAQTIETLYITDVETQQINATFNRISEILVKEEGTGIVNALQAKTQLSVLIEAITECSREQQATIFQYLGVTMKKQDSIQTLLDKLLSDGTLTPVLVQTARTSFINNVALWSGKVGALFRSFWYDRLAITNMVYQFSVYGASYFGRGFEQYQIWSRTLNDLSDDKQFGPDYAVDLAQARMNSARDNAWRTITWSMMTITPLVMTGGIFAVNMCGPRFVASGFDLTACTAGFTNLLSMQGLAAFMFTGRVMAFAEPIDYIMSISGAIRGNKTDRAKVAALTAIAPVDMAKGTLNAVDKVWSEYSKSKKNTELICGLIANVTSTEKKTRGREESKKKGGTRSRTPARKTTETTNLTYEQRRVLCMERALLRISIDGQNTSVRGAAQRRRTILRTIASNVNNKALNPRLRGNLRSDQIIRELFTTIRRLTEGQTIVGLDGPNDSDPECKHSLFSDEDVHGEEEAQQ